jgi:nucleoside-diphosphate-sugar epimerase
MRVFITGASGWIGSALIPDLLEAGHRVVGLARSDQSAAKLTAAGVEQVRGDLADLALVRSTAEVSDGVIHLAFGHDFSQMEAAIRADRQALKAIGAALEGSGKPFVAASGTPAVSGRPATEQDDPAWGGPMAGRAENGRYVVGLAERGIRSSVVRIPRSAHGQGDAHGLVARLVGVSRANGVAGYVGDGSSRWPAVHVRDAARLFRLALEKGAPGSVFHAVGDEGVAIRDMAQVIGRKLQLPVESVAADRFGFLGPLLNVDQPASSAHTQEVLGWAPTHAGLLSDLEAGFYTA